MREKADFQRVRRRGSSFSSPILAMYIHPNDGQVAKFGIVTGKRIGNAVVRNRVKRRIRESVRSLLSELQGGVDVLFVARPSIVAADFARIYSTVTKLARKANLYQPSG